MIGLKIKIMWYVLIANNLLFKDKYMSVFIIKTHGRQFTVKSYEPGVDQN